MVENFKTQTFTQGSVILKVFNYKPSHLKFQQLPVGKKLKRLR